MDFEDFSSMSAISACCANAASVSAPSMMTFKGTANCPGERLFGAAPDRRPSLADQRFVFLGAGEASVNIMNLNVR
ncbi:hypothetical protein [Candidatus Amarobacter glycogenicus]|uniref:hypothetical protein n=1 Tax=Candidatus Amarobacter glycogenicus TaxID=3140699 RepID=UPI00313729B5|nr:hypothetical protein [Dehalococcoidia bacterium]